MKFIAFFLISIITFLSLMALYGQSQAEMQSTTWFNATSNASSDFYNETMGVAPAPECKIGSGWTSFTSIPTCVYNYMSYGISASATTSVFPLIAIFIFLPFGAVFMFMLVKAFIRG